MLACCFDFTFADGSSTFNFLPGGTTKRKCEIAN